MASIINPLRAYRPPTQAPRAVIQGGTCLGDRLMVGQQTLTLFIVVRVHVPQPIKKLPNLGSFFIGCADSWKEAPVRQNSPATVLRPPASKKEGAQLA